jgi:hypothetical protein
MFVREERERLIGERVALLLCPEEDTDTSDQVR